MELGWSGGEGGIAALSLQDKQNQRVISRPNASCVPVLCPEVDRMTSSHTLERILKFPGLQAKVTPLSRLPNAGDDRLPVTSIDDVADIPSQKSDDHHAPASHDCCRDTPSGRKWLEANSFF